jgi:hypothetical protein
MKRSCVALVILIASLTPGCYEAPPPPADPCPGEVVKIEPSSSGIGIVSFETNGGAHDVLFPDSGAYRQDGTVMFLSQDRQAITMLRRGDSTSGRDIVYDLVGNRRRRFDLAPGRWYLDVTNQIWLYACDGVTISNIERSAPALEPPPPSTTR